MGRGGLVSHTLLTDSGGVGGGGAFKVTHVFRKLMDSEVEGDFEGHTYSNQECDGKRLFFFFFSFLRNTEICDKRRPSQAYALSFPPVSNHTIQNFSFPAPKQWPLLKKRQITFLGWGSRETITNTC